MRDIEMDDSVCRSHGGGSETVETSNPDEVKTLSPDAILTNEDKEVLRTGKLLRKLENIKKELQEVYFFNEKEINSVMEKNTGNDAYLLEQIVRDVQKQYAKVPLDVPIEEYLYDTLMNIEPLDMGKRQEDILSKIDDTLDGQNTTKLSYLDFPMQKDSSAKKSSSQNETDEAIHKKARRAMKDYVKQDVQDFFVIRINNVKRFEDEKKKEMTSRFVQKNISGFSEYGTNLYVFIQKDGTKRIVVGSNIGQRGSIDDQYFGKLAEKYNATRVEVPLSRFVKAPQ